MRIARWGLLLSSAAGIAVLAGCAGMPRLVSATRYEELLTAQRLNASQAVQLAELINEKVQLQKEIDSLKKQGSAMGELTAAQRALLESKQREVDELKAAKANAQKDFTGLGDDVVVGERGGNIVVSVAGEVLFSPGQADLLPQGKTILDTLAKKLATKDNDYEIAGYTDSDPIKVSRWQSNFQLSGERALSVLNYLAEKGVPAAKMHYAGYGEHRLVKNAAGVEDKKKSRHVEIIILMKSGKSDEMIPAGAPLK